MKEQDLVDLGFERIDIDEDAEKFHYFSYDLNNESGCGSLISDSSDTVDSDDAWEVYAWDINEQLVFTNPKDIKTYIDVLEKNIITKQV
jgi:hypothetical protein|tara:strand:+ start:216 stop:482 length:267 start_codon:yes stop_codon:yes gene_type:complete